MFKDIFLRHKINLAIYLVKDFIPYESNYLLLLLLLVREKAKLNKYILNGAF